MTRIFKYPLRITDEQAMRLPAGAEVLAAQMQGETLCVWAVVDPDAALEWVGFRVVGTGHAFPERDSWRYVGTAQMYGGSLVWHVFTSAPTPDTAPLNAENRP